MERMVIGFGALLTMLGCIGADDTRACTPGTTLACLCGTRVGSQICNDEGSGYGICMCDGVDSGIAAADTSVSAADTSVSATDTGVVSDTSAAAAGSIEGRWCAPVAGWTTSNVYTFDGVSFTVVAMGDIPSGEPVDGGCHITSTARGTYTTSSGVLSLTFIGTPTDELTNCDNPGDNGAWAATPRGPENIPYSVRGATLTLGSGADGALLTAC